MKRCIYPFITKNVSRSWVFVPSMAILKEKVVTFPFKFAHQVPATPRWAVTSPAGDTSRAGDKPEAELQAGLCHRLFWDHLK